MVIGGAGGEEARQPTGDVDMKAWDVEIVLDKASSDSSSYILLY